jgi:hypothetical protein
VNEAKPKSDNKKKQMRNNKINYREKRVLLKEE